MNCIKKKFENLLDLDSNMYQMRDDIKGNTTKIERPIDINCVECASQLHQTLPRNKTISFFTSIFKSKKASTSIRQLDI